MKAVMNVHWDIAEHWHHCRLPVSAVFATDDAYAAFYTSKYLIQDTAEAIFAHLDRGFSKDPMAAYLEFWGVMQAIFIQQDAICELYESVFGKKAATHGLNAWATLRDLRNRCAGHPANKTIGGGSLRSFMGRGFGPYERITYEQYDSSTRTRTHPTFNLKALINSYDAEAARLLSAVLAEMKRKCP
jgi:hypothetical protein